MVTSGRRLLVAFATGAIAASLLFAIPLFTIRDRVQELQAQEDRRLASMRGQMAEALEAAGAQLAAPGLASTGNLTRAGVQVGTAAGLANVTEPANGSLASTLTGTSRFLQHLVEARACNLIAQPDVLATGLSHLASQLARTASALRADERVSPATVEGTLRTVAAALGQQLRERGLANATLELAGESAHVRVALGGPGPAIGCRSELAIEACAMDGEQVLACERTNGTASAFERVGQSTVRVPAPEPSDGASGVRVTVTDLQLGRSIEASCVLEPRDGASCS